MTAFEALCGVAKTKPKAGEDFEAFALRLTDKINKVSDADWQSLGDDGPAQKWHNETMTAFDKRRAAKAEAVKKNEDVDEAWASVEIPELEGFEAAPAKAVTKEEEEPEVEKVDDETGEVTTEKAPAKKKAAVKETKAKEKVAKEAAPKKAATAKVPKAKKEGKRGRAPLYPEDAKIKLLVKENPHRPKTGRYDRWKHYKDGMTVAEAYKRGLEPVNLRYSVLDKHIQIK